MNGLCANVVLAIEDEHHAFVQCWRLKMQCTHGIRIASTDECNVANGSLKVQQLDIAGAEKALLVIH